MQSLFRTAEPRMILFLPVPVPPRQNRLKNKDNKRKEVKKMKKCLSFFLALTFLFGITEAPSLAEGTHTITIQITGNGTVTPNEGGSALVNLSLIHIFLKP